MVKNEEEGNIYCNYGSLGSSGCYFGAKSCVDSEWEPGAVGQQHEWQVKQISSRISTLNNEVCFGRQESQTKEC